MDLKDWMSVADNFNTIARIKDDRRRTDIYQRQADVDDERVGEAIRVNRDTENLARQKAVIKNAIDKNPWLLTDDAPPQPEQPAQANEPSGSLPAAMSGGPAVAPGSLRSAAQQAAPSPALPTESVRANATAPGFDLSEMDPRAVAEARIEYYADQHRKAIMSEDVQKQVRAKTDLQYENWTRALTKAAQLADQGSEEMAADVYAAAYNEYYKDGFQASVDGNEFVLTSPTGKETRVPVSGMKERIFAAIKGSSPEKFYQNYVVSNLAFSEFNRGAAFKPEPLYDDSGNIAAYRVTGIDPETQRPTYEDWSGQPYAPGSRKIAGGSGLKTEAEFKAARESQDLQNGILSPQEQKAVSVAAEKGVSHLKSLLEGMHPKDETGVRPGAYGEDYFWGSNAVEQIVKVYRGRISGVAAANMAAQAVAEARTALSEQYKAKTKDANDEVKAQYGAEDAYIARNLGDKVAERLTAIAPNANAVQGVPQDAPKELTRALAGIDKAIANAKTPEEKAKYEKMRESAIAHFGGPSAGPGVMSEENMDAIAGTGSQGQASSWGPPPPEIASELSGNDPASVPAGQVFTGEAGGKRYRIKSDGKQWLVEGAATNPDTSGAPGSRRVGYPAPARPKTQQQKDAAAARSAAAKVWNWGGLAEEIKKTKHYKD